MLEGIWFDIIGDLFGEHRNVKEGTVFNISFGKTQEILFSGKFYNYII